MRAREPPPWEAASLRGRGAGPGRAEAGPGAGRGDALLLPPPARPPAPEPQGQHEVEGIEGGGRKVDSPGTARPRGSQPSPPMQRHAVHPAARCCTLSPPETRCEGQASSLCPKSPVQEGNRSLGFSSLVRRKDPRVSTTTRFT
ncbi:translation initiation factor IF-2-like [Vulpes lagopus]|uniref:translation initiation factor IF-2-like n=1 Tax=Vulpes lagopus TaxID=494514 RepID=UPI001BC9893C|nr:translation initiation factor IF-2-like [Vulpes lagopus]